METNEVLSRTVLKALSDDTVACTAFKTSDELRNDLTRISQIRDWARGLKDEGIRLQYISWLDYFEQQHLSDLATRDIDDAAKALLPSIPRPLEVLQ